MIRRLLCRWGFHVKPSNANCVGFWCHGCRAVVWTRKDGRR